ncbi:unnamed protein product, partial [Ectocarpus sp. 4 AP-2014]
GQRRLHHLDSIADPILRPELNTVLLYCCTLSTGDDNGKGLAAFHFLLLFFLPPTYACMFLFSPQVQRTLSSPNPHCAFFSTMCVFRPNYNIAPFVSVNRLNTRSCCTPLS